MGFVMVIRRVVIVDGIWHGGHSDGAQLWNLLSVGLVIDGMLKLRRQGEDPLTVLKTVPNVENTCEEGPYW